MLAAVLLTGGAGAALAQAQTTSPTIAPPTAVDTQTFVDRATASNQFEVMSSELALQKASDQQVKAYAEQMIQDHRRAGAKLVEARPDAKAPPIDGRLSLGAREQGMLVRLEGADGKDFDRLYVDMQRQAHREAIELFRAYAASGDVPALVRFAQEALPELESHQRMAERLVIS